MAVIDVRSITKDYGNSRGVFDVSFGIEKGEVFGFLGPNGAGKTTTIRQILGFIKPDHGEIAIEGIDTWEHPEKTNAHIGYLAGEIAFPEKITVKEMIRYQADLEGLKNLSKADALLERFEIKAVNSDVKRLSKGMKQKLGLVLAFMADPDILILDEPTSGLDPLMQEAFVQLIKKEKERGKTILLSSHLFTEVEKTCDRAAIIRQGRIASEIDIHALENSPTKEYQITFATPEECRRFIAAGFALSNVDEDRHRVTLSIANADIHSLLVSLAGYQVTCLSEVKVTLEDYFMRFYTAKK